MFTRKLTLVDVFSGSYFKYLVFSQITGTFPELFRVFKKQVSYKFSYYLL